MLENGKAKLRHNDFMTKIRKELNILKSLELEGLRNFSQSSYINSQGKEQPCFELNKESIYETRYGTKVNITTYITGKGQLYFQKENKRVFQQIKY